MPGAPVTPDVEQWRVFYAENGLGKGKSADLVALKVQIAEEQLRKIRRENEEGDGRVVDEQTIRDFLRDWAAKLDLLLTAELETNLPPLLDGKPIAEIRVEMRNVHDRIRQATSRGLLNWTPESN